jgi:tetratricopeptide (TPR) repeat protein
MRGLSESDTHFEGGSGSAPGAQRTLDPESIAGDLAERSLTGFEQPAGAGERYAVICEIAHGGGGRILRARDRRLGRDVALKVPFDGRGEARLRLETSVTARLEHPAIVPVHDAGRLPDGRIFFSMKLIAGRSLSDAVGDAASGADRLAFLPSVVAVADALAYAHAQGVIHRDVKPQNVLVGPFGETALIDWGLAKPLPDEAAPDGSLSLGPLGSTQTGAVLGTPAYMPPEQARGEAADARADVYGLGTLLYFVLSGRAPLSHADVLADVRTPGPLEPHALGVPPELCAIAGKAMAPDPQDRYAGAGELAADLRRFQAGLLVGAYKYSRGAIVRRFVRRNRAWLLVAVLAAFALTATAAASLRRVVRDRALQARQRAAAETLSGFALDDLRERLKPLARADLLRSLAESVSRYYEELSQSAPLDLAEKIRWGRALIHLGEVRSEAELQDQAIASFRQARALFADASPDDLAAKMEDAGVGALIAKAELNSGRPAQALAEASRAVAQMKLLVALAQPQAGPAWRRALAEARLVEGMVLLQSRQLEAAGVSWRESLSLAEELARELPDERAVRELMAKAHARSAMLADRRYDPETALRHAGACADWTRRLLAGDPDAPLWLRLLDTCLTYRARAQGDLRALAAAVATHREVLEYSRRNARRDPESGTNAHYLVLSLNQLGDAEADLGRFDAARAAFEEAEILGPDLLRRDPLHARRAEVVLSTRIQRARVELEAGNWQTALVTARAASAEAERLAAALPGNRYLENGPPYCDMYVARALIGLHRARAAVAPARRAVAAFERLTHEEPEDRLARHELAVAEGVLGDALAGLIPHEAIRHYRRAIELQDSLFAAHQDIEWRILRAQLLARLAALEPPPAGRAHLREAVAVMSAYADGRLTFHEQRELAAARAALARR